MNCRSGREAQLDFNHCNSLGVTIGNRRYRHLLFQPVLSHSGWRYAEVVAGETFLRTRRYTSTLYIHHTIHGVGYNPMNDGGRYSIQSPIASNLPPTRPTLPPPLTGAPSCAFFRRRKAPRALSERCRALAARRKAAAARLALGLVLELMTLPPVMRLLGSAPTRTQSASHSSISSCRCQSHSPP